MGLFTELENEQEGGQVVRGRKEKAEEFSFGCAELAAPVGHQMELPGRELVTAYSCYPSSSP